MTINYRCATSVVFLDVDGVLNSSPYLAGLTERHGTYDGNEERMLDPAAVERVNQIVERTGAAVVISSSWRQVHRMPDLRMFLRKRGLRGHVVIGVTPTARTGSGSCLGALRGSEIQEWLDAHRHVTSFAILDDSADMGHLVHKLIQTSYGSGLLDEHVERAVAMLGMKAATPDVDQP